MTTAPLGQPLKRPALQPAARRAVRTITPPRFSAPGSPVYIERRTYYRAMTITKAGSARCSLVATAGVLVAAATAARLLAEGGLVAGSGPWWGPLQLQLAYNSGVAFGLGAWLPGWLVTAVTGVITLGLAVWAWFTVPAAAAATRLGLAAILVGAIANLLDRAVEGVVTDYLHTGWFPTFNLPDVFITVGAALLVVGALRAPGSARSPVPGASAPPPRRTPLMGSR